MFTWVSSLLFIGILTGCGDSADQTSVRSADLAVSKMAAVQAALDQAIVAQNAIEEADSSRAIALKNAKDKRVAVEQAIALATRESDALKKEAESHVRWAALIHERAVESRQVLLLAAMEQAKAKQILIEKEKAVEEARKNNITLQHDAQIAMLTKLKAEKLLEVVLAAEQLATISINQSVPKSIATINNNSGEIMKQVAASAPKAATVKNSPSKSVSAPKKQYVKATIKAPSKAAVKLAKASSPHSANAARGRDLTTKCQSCHTFGPNQKGKLGPNLFGVVGQQAGKSQNFRYGSALAKADFTWNEQNLTEWICHSGKAIKNLTGNPYASTRMSAQKVCGQDAKDLVAYLRTLKTQASAKSRSGS